VASSNTKFNFFHYLVSRFGR